MHRAALFQRRTFHLVTLAFHDVANLLFLRVGQIQVFKHHHLMVHTRLAFMMHHHFAFSWRGGRGGGICGERHAGSAQSQGRGNKQCS